MARIGIFALPWFGHLIPAAGLARELVSRGHDVVFFTIPDRAEWIRARGLQPLVIGEELFPPGSLARLGRKQSELGGLDGMAASLEVTTRLARATLGDGQVIAGANLDLYVADQLDWAASTHAQYTGTPFVTAIFALNVVSEDGVPGMSGEIYPMDEASRVRDRSFNEAASSLTGALREVIDSFRLQAGMTPFSYETLPSPFAWITQQPQEFEFPRRQLPDWFHFTGPFTLGDERPTAQFPWERLDGRPLVYVSFGTVSNANVAAYETVAEATSDPDVQTIVSLGRQDSRVRPPTLPGDPIVVPFAPQIEILNRADLLVTHAGMNSALEAVSCGVPMVAVPVSFDQFGVAARIEWTGTGVRVPAEERTPERVRQAVETVLRNGSYREAARRFQERIAQIDGPGRASAIIERVIETGRPVLRTDM